MLSRCTKVAAACASAVLALGISSFASAANPGIVGKMDEIFGDMSNVTRPGVYKTARRGIISGGGVSTRSRIVDTSLVNINLQTPTGGCGGIDAFAGSISFINADQFVELLPSIASNAKGYAFQVAMNAASGMIASILGDMQKVIQAMNDLNINSCQLAQGIVNTGLEAVGASELGNGVTLTSALSGFSDVAESFRKFGTSKNPEVEAHQAASSNASVKSALDSTYGNIMWKELKRNNVTKLLPSSDEDFEYGALMAVTGTYVVEAPKENEASPQTADYPITPYVHLIEPSDYIEGGNFSIYTCKSDTEGCVTPQRKANAVAYKGLKQQILDALLGTDGSAGLIAKFHSNEGAKLTDAELKILSGLPVRAATIISNLSMYSVDMAKDQAEELAYAIAGHIAFDLTRQYLRTVRFAIAGSKMTAAKEPFLNMINARLSTLDTQYLAYTKLHKSLADLMSGYNDVQKNIVKVALLSGRAGKQTGSEGSTN